MTIMELTLYKRNQTVRTVLFTDQARAIQAACKWIERHPDRDWEDRSACLYGNVNRPVEEWEVFKWINPNLDLELTINPVKVHGAEGWTLIGG